MSNVQVHSQDAVLLPESQVNHKDSRRYLPVAAGVAALGTLAVAESASAQAADPIGDVTATASALQGIVGTGLVIGIAIMGFGIGSRILRKMSRG